MTPTERFIRNAVDGGWRYHNHKEIHFFESPLKVAPSIQVEYNDGYRERVPLSEFLIDPAFWRAAGKAIMWDRTDAFCAHEGLIKALWDGQTADAYLGRLLIDDNRNE